MAASTLQRTQEDLQAIHDQLKQKLTNLINNDLKFEVCTAMARKIIRTDYHTIDLNEFTEHLPQSLLEHQISIMVDPMLGTKQTYKKIIDNIFAASAINNQIKSGKYRTRNEKLMLLIDINYIYSVLAETSPDKILEHLESMFIVDVIDKPLDRKEVRDNISLLKAIKRTNDNISFEQFTVRD